jgi:predicted DNA-binding transcriptional regulator YafY
MGHADYQGSSFPGLQAYCHDSQAQRTFRLDRIMKVEVPEEN